MPDNTYQVGEVAPLEATFKNASGAPTNTTCVLEVRAPDGTVTTPSPTNSGAGVYHYDQAITMPGLWWYAFIGTGAVTATEQGSFYAQARYTQTGQYPLTATALVTLDEAREFVQGNPADDRIDGKLIRRIKEFSVVVANYTRREWGPITVGDARTFSYPGYGMLSLSPYDLRSATLVKAYTNLPTSQQITLTPGDTSTVGDYQLRPIGGAIPASTFRWLEFTWGPAYLSVESYDGYWWGPNRRSCSVTVTGNWGIDVIPEDVKLATLIAIKDSIENPTQLASRTIGPVVVDEVPEDPGFPEGRWRALPAESRALLSPYTLDAGVLVA